MHPSVLGTSGYALLLSGVVSLVILLRKNLKRCLGSSLHMLTMSDILSSLLTGILLIFNQYSQSFNGPFTDNWPNDTISETWMDFVNMDDREFIGSLRSVHAKQDEENGIGDEKHVCDFKDAIMHYAMFLFPFVNAFASLLTFSVRSNVDMKYISRKCERLIDSGGSCEQTPGGSDEKCERTRKRREMTVTGLGIAGQWLLPVLMTLVLQFAGLESPENMQRSRDIGCVYGTNFPFENCHVMDTMMDDGFFNRTKYTTPSANDYIESIDEFTTSHENSTAPHAGELTEVVSRVYHIIGMLKNSSDSETNTKNPSTFYGASQLMNITQFMAKPSSTEKYEEEPIGSETKSQGSTFAPQIHPNEELQLFENLLKNSSDLPRETEFIGDDQQLEDAETEISEVFEAPHDIVVKPLSDDVEEANRKIFADIVKKIQAVSTQLRVRDPIQSSRRPDRARSQKPNNRSTTSFMSENGLEKTHVCRTDRQCFLSTKFLKMHLLFLVFLIYFIPILISAILHTRTNYVCRSIKEKIQMRATIEAAARKPDSSDDKSGAGPSGWFPTIVSKENEISGGSSEDLVPSEKFKSTAQSRIKAIDKHTDTADVLKLLKDEMSEMDKLSRLFKTSLLFGVLLWTPAFLEVLAKVFLCIDCVDWLMNISFLGALLFGILRNILDLRMIRAREILQNNNKKDNSVCPSS